MDTQEALADDDEENDERKDTVRPFNCTGDKDDDDEEDIGKILEKRGLNF